MVFMKRAQEIHIKNDLKDKYVLLAGPRQAGKTTLSKQIYPETCEYLSYDLSSDRRIIVSGQWNRESELIILDEFHKFPKWKTFLKGYYDTEGNIPPILVTGSAKMNIFKKGNDSMVGRYYYHRLLPLSVKELESKSSPKESLERLLEYGNFPEPFLSKSKIKSKRWREAYLDKVVKEDVTDFSNIKQIHKLELLVDLLRERVGSQISYASLARDLEIAPKTVKEWINLLEELYLIFRITPYSKNIARSILKEPKIYFFDSSMAFNPEAHLENLVAVSLLKHLWFLEDTQGAKTSLHYLRTKDGLEVDFLTSIDRKVTEMIEVKNSDSSLHKPMLHFSKFFKDCRKYQIIRNLKRKKTIDTIQITHVHEYLSGLEI